MLKGAKTEFISKQKRNYRCLVVKKGSDIKLQPIKERKDCVRIVTRKRTNKRTAAGTLSGPVLLKSFVC
jgi:hypothetical protein